VPAPLLFCFILQQHIVFLMFADSPADLHGMWYPTVRRTLVCLSRLYRCVDRPIFQGLSQEALSMCIQSVASAAQAISSKKVGVGPFFIWSRNSLLLTFRHYHYADLSQNVVYGLGMPCISVNHKSNKIPFPVHTDMRHSKSIYNRPFTLTIEVCRKSVPPYIGKINHLPRTRQQYLHT